MCPYPGKDIWHSERQRRVSPWQGSPLAVHSAKRPSASSHVSSRRKLDLSQGKPAPFIVIHEVDTWNAWRENIQNRHGHQSTINSIELMVWAVRGWKMFRPCSSVGNGCILSMVDINAVPGEELIHTVNGESTRKRLKPEGLLRWSLCTADWYFLYNSNFSSVYEARSRIIYKGHQQKTQSTS